MDPWFGMFFDALDLAKERSRVWWQQGGAWFHEMMWTFGVMPSDGVMNAILTLIHAILSTPFSR